MRRSILPAAVAFAVFLLPAQALGVRTWVSGKGVDLDGCGAAANPCRTLQFAHDRTSAGGEIDILDPAGYGSIAISKSISIVNDGAGVAGLFAGDGTPAVSIESESISVLLRGLTIDGAGSRTAAVTFMANGSLSVQNCLFKNSGGLFAVADAPSSIRILNSTFLNSSQSIEIMQYGNRQTLGPLKVLIDNTTVMGGALNAIVLSKSGANRMNFTISNSTVSSNITGVKVEAGVDGIISNSTITQNQFGIWGVSSGVTLSGNTIHGNYDTGVYAGGGMKSFGDNKITGNGIDVSGYLTTVSAR